MPVTSAIVASDVLESDDGPPESVGMREDGHFRRECCCHAVANSARATVGMLSRKRGHFALLHAGSVQPTRSLRLRGLPYQPNG